MSDQTRKNCLQTKQRTGGGVMKDNKVIEAVEEASISVACLLDVVHGEELQKDVEHIQDQLSLIENFFGEKSDE